MAQLEGVLGFPLSGQAAFVRVISLPFLFFRLVWACSGEMSCEVGRMDGFKLSQSTPRHLIVHQYEAVRSSFSCHLQRWVAFVSSY